MSKNTSISLGDYFDDFIHKKIMEGRYKNVSEIIRAGLRLLEEEEHRHELLLKRVTDTASSSETEKSDQTDIGKNNHLKTHS